MRSGGTPTADVKAPFKREAEMAVLGAALVAPLEVLPQLEEVEPGDFYLRPHRLVWEVVRDLAGAGKPIDTLTVGDALEARGLLGEVGGHSYLAELANSFTTTTSVAYYADIIRRSARQRKVADLARQLAEEAEKGSLDGTAHGLLREIGELLGSPAPAGAEPIYFEALPEAPEAAWVVHGLLSHPRIVGLAGKRAAFKTWVGLHLGLAVATGSPAFGHFKVPEPAPVLYLNAENPPDIIAKRLRLLATQTGEPLEGTLAVAHFPAVSLRAPEGLTQFKRLLKEVVPKLVVVDSIARIWGVKDELQNQQIAEAMQNLRELSEEFNTTMLFLHHLRKSPTLGRDAGDVLETVRGGSELVNLADAFYVLKRRGEEPAVLVRCGKFRDGPEPDPFRVRLGASEGEVALRWEGAGAAGEGEDSAVDAAAAEVVTFLEGQPAGYLASTSELKEALRTLGFSERTVQRALKALVEAGDLERPAHGRYRLPS